jgi:hypothetical protein
VQVREAGDVQVREAGDVQVREGGIDTSLGFRFRV